MTELTKEPLGHTLEGHRADILTESLLVIANLVLIAWFASKMLRTPWTSDPILHFLVAASVVMLLGVLALAAGMSVVKARGQRLLRRERELSPRVIGILTGIAMGDDREDELRRFHRRAPEIVEHLVCEFLGVQKGPGYLRVVAAAQASGIVEKWRRLAASPQAERRCNAIVSLGLLPPGIAEKELREGLRDEEELVSVEASRALIRAGNKEDIERVFFEFPRQTSLVKALQSPYLRRHAALLLERAVPESLQSGDPSRIGATLELLADWRRAVHVPDLATLLSDARPRIRAAAFRALPFSLEPPPAADVFRDALESTDPDVRCAALFAAGRIRVSGLEDSMAQIVRNASPEVAIAAAFALAGSGAIASLEQIVIAAGPIASAIAAEAVEKYRVGRLDI